MWRVASDGGDSYNVCRWRIELGLRLHIAMYLYKPYGRMHNFACFILLYSFKGINRTPFILVTNKIDRPYLFRENRSTDRSLLRLYTVKRNPYNYTTRSSRSYYVNFSETIRWTINISIQLIMV